MFNNLHTQCKLQNKSVALLLCAALCLTQSVSPLHAQASSTLPGTSTTRMIAAIAKIDEKAPPVIVQRVEAGEISQMLQTSGDVLPYLGADIHPKIGGEIVAINVSEGSQVKQGDILAEIDHRILDAQLEQAKAAVSVAKSNVDAQNVQLKSAESALVSARAQVAAVKAQATNLSATRKRFADLFKEGAVSEQQLDDIVAQHDAIQAQLIAAESTVRQAEDGIQSGQVNLKMRNAQLLQAPDNIAPHPGGHHAVVYVRDPDAGVPIDEQALRQRFGLTPAEARTAAALAAGGTLPEHSELRKLRPMTIRSYVKQVFARTGTHSQLDLVRLVLTGVAAITGGSR